MMPLGLACVARSCFLDLADVGERSKHTGGIDERYGRTLCNVNGGADGKDGDPLKPFNLLLSLAFGSSLDEILFREMVRTRSRPVIRLQISELERENAWPRCGNLV